MSLIKTDVAHRERYMRVAFWGFVAVAAFYLLTEHRAHVFGWAPYLIFLLCPLMHIFMHRSHSHSAEKELESQSEHTTHGHDHR